MSDQNSDPLDTDFSDYKDARFYDVSLCFTFMDMDDCVTFEMVSDGKMHDKASLVQALIEGYGGVAEMEDGTIINLKQYVNAWVVETEENAPPKSTSRFSVLH
jgi:hypothetical protein